MLCSNCNIRSICTIFDLIKDKRISINECEFCTSKTTASINNNSISNSSNNNIALLNNSVRTSRANNDLRELEKKIYGKEDKKETITTCPTCKGTCYDSSIKICDGDNCSNFVCDNCGTSFNGLVLCEECYAKV